MSSTWRRDHKSELKTWEEDHVNDGTYNFEEVHMEGLRKGSAEDKTWTKDHVQSHMKPEAWVLQRAECEIWCKDHLKRRNFNLAWRIMHKTGLET
jgi:hypothetical protein